MKLLVIGGSRFVGRHLIEAAIEQGHQITTFNRGQSNPGLYPAVEEIHGDRDGDLQELRGREWDVVIDTSGYVPRIVRKSAQLLKDHVGKYIFVSSISVYADMETGNIDEELGAVHELEDPTVEEITGATYGGLKVLCERSISELYGERAVHVRAGFIVGRYDTAWRLPHLIHRYDSPGDKLAGRPEQAVQFISATDLGLWMLKAAANEASGVYNLTGQLLRMDALLDEIIRQTGSGARPVYTGDAFLQANEVAPVDGLTYWVPEESEKLMHAPIQRALDTGLELRSLAQIIADTLPWARQQQWADVPERLRAVAMLPEREAALLEKFAAERG